MTLVWDMYRAVGVDWHCVGWGHVDNTMVVGACKRQQGCDELVCGHGCICMDLNLWSWIQLVCGH